MNEYIRQVYQQRLVEAEAARLRVIEIQQAILEKWRLMAKEGRFYLRGERDVDSNALKEAEDQFRYILESVYQIEDDEQNTRR